MRRFNVKTTVGAMIVGLAVAFAGVAHATTDTELVAESNSTKATFMKTDPGLATFFGRAAGYAIFPQVTKGGIGIGGAHGDGILYQNGRPVGKATLSQLTVGAQLGGQTYSQVVFFETPHALATFMNGKTNFSGNASAVALKSGASASAKYQDGVAVFTATTGGLMLEASLGGQKFSYEPFVVAPK